MSVSNANDESKLGSPPNSRAVCGYLASAIYSTQCNITLPVVDWTTESIRPTHNRRIDLIQVCEAGVQSGTFALRPRDFVRENVAVVEGMET
jgi:hypothetical protein